MIKNKIYNIMKKQLFVITLALFGFALNTYAQCVQCDEHATHLGTNASVLGTNTSASGNSAFASGYNSDASGNYSTAIGCDASATGTCSVAIGTNVHSQNTTFTIGRDISASGMNTIIIGNGYASEAMLSSNLSKSIIFGMQSSTPSMIIRQQSSSQNTPAFVGVGTTDPKQMFHVNGNVMISDNNKSLLFASSASSTYGDFGIRFTGSGLNFYLPNEGTPTNYLLFIKNNGNIGIGTNTPSFKFEVAGAAKATSLQTGSLYVTGEVNFRGLAGNTTKVMTINDNGDLLTADFSTLQDNMGNHKASQNLNMNGFKIVNDNNNGGVFIDTCNNVGIGTLYPKQMLHVVGGNILISRTSSRDNMAPGSTNGSILFGDMTSTQYPHGSWGIEYNNDNEEGHGLNFWKTFDSHGGPINHVLFLCEESAYIGNVGIGTAKPKHKLSVNGTIQAKELIVTTLANDWPDYVFDTEYKLTSLHELDKYVKSERHLPGVPSADEIEEDGVKVGEMNKMLLQKIEELTLYVIELQKQIDELKGDN